MKVLSIISSLIIGTCLLLLSCGNKNTINKSQQEKQVVKQVEQVEQPKYILYVSKGRYFKIYECKKCDFHYGIIFGTTIDGKHIVTTNGYYIEK